MEDRENSENLSKETRVFNEIQRLEKILDAIDIKTKKAVHSLISNAAFMHVTLEELQEAINEKGVVEKYQNGQHQWGIKKSAEIEIYNSLVKNHMAAMKQLTDLLPKQEKIVEDDGFDDFVAGK